MEKQITGKAIWYRFEALTGFENLVHGVFTRTGGVSHGAWAELNLGNKVGDDPDAVTANRKIAAGILNAPTLAFANQVHGDSVVCIKEPCQAEFFDAGPCDAMISDVRDTFLVILVADCQAILLYDPIKKAIGNVHSGWRGSVAGVAKKTVAMMALEFGSRPEDLVACICPSLGPCCSEFVNYRNELPKSFRKYETTRNHFDFWAITRDQLQNAGLRDSNIHNSGVCTVCAPDCFSYRRDKVTGRLAMVIGMKGE